FAKSLPWTTSGRVVAVVQTSDAPRTASADAPSPRMPPGIAPTLADADPRARPRRASRATPFSAAPRSAAPMPGLRLLLRPRTRTALAILNVVPLPGL